MKDQPLVSIIIPTYNRANLIGETLDSIIAQTFKNWECLVIDDGSNDNTKDLVNHYEYIDKRIKYYQRPKNFPSGGNGARNYGFIKSTGKYVKWLDSDDLLTPNILLDEFNILNKNEDVQFVYCPWQTFNKTQKFNIQNKNVLDSPNNGLELLQSIGKNLEYVLLGSYTINRNIIYYSGLWNSSLKINQDGEFLFRVLLNCNKIKSISNVGFLYRDDSQDKITKKNNLEIAYERLKSWKIIENQVYLINKQETNNYLKSIKQYLYRHHINKKEYDFVASNFSFFKNEIKSEKNKKLKLKLNLKIIKHGFYNCPLL